MAAAMTGPTPNSPVRLVPAARTAAASFFLVSRIAASTPRRSSVNFAASSQRAAAAGREPAGISLAAQAPIALETASRRCGSPQRGCPPRTVAVLGQARTLARAAPSSRITIFPDMMLRLRAAEVVL